MATSQSQYRLQSRFANSLASSSPIRHSIASSTGPQFQPSDSPVPAPRRRTASTRFIGRNKTGASGDASDSSSEADLTLSSTRSIRSTRFISPKRKISLQESDISMLINSAALDFPEDSDTDTQKARERNDTRNSSRNWSRPMNPMLNRSRFAPHSADGYSTISTDTSRREGLVDSMEALALSQSDIRRRTDGTPLGRSLQEAAQKKRNQPKRDSGRTTSSQASSRLSTPSPRKASLSAAKKKSIWDQTFISASFADVDANASLRDIPVPSFPRIEPRKAAVDMDFEPTVNTAKLSDIFGHTMRSDKSHRLGVRSPKRSYSDRACQTTSHSIKSDKNLCQASSLPSVERHTIGSAKLDIDALRTPEVTGRGTARSSTQETFDVTETSRKSYLQDDDRPSENETIEELDSISADSFEEEEREREEQEATFDKQDDGVEDDTSSSLDGSHPTEEIVILRSLKMLQRRCALLEKEKAAALQYVESLHVLLRAQSPQ